ncbi:MAG TPA: hypothetical protein VNM48_18550, partial [Chloroflexota bacterium]|nr:hypothetical protein [Chloroflexota bacterium]
ANRIYWREGNQALWGCQLIMPGCQEQAGPVHCAGLAFRAAPHLQLRAASPGGQAPVAVPAPPGR